MNWLTRIDLTQILALITMERPGSFSAEDLRQEKVSCTILLISPVFMYYTGSRPPTCAACRNEEYNPRPIQ